MTKFLIIGIILFIATIILTITQKCKPEKALRIFATGIFIVAIILLCPLIISHNKIATENEVIPLITIVLAVLQLGSLDGDYSFWISEASNISTTYRIFFSCICYCMPLVFCGFILSLFEGFVSIFKYKCMKYFRNTFFFSELNENSFILASSILEENNKSLIIFYDFNGNNELKAEAFSKGFIILNYDCEKLIHKPNHKVSFFMIKENQDKNLSDGLKVLNLYKTKFKKIKKLENVTISIFSENKTSETILNSVDKKEITVKLINVHRRIANDLIFNYPFYKAPGWKENKTISVLVIGAGQLGLEIIKNAIWSCQFGSDYKLEINVIDKNAAKAKTILKHECPEFFNIKWGLNLNFYDADVRTTHFDETIKNCCRESNYITICLNNDELAIDTALFLRKFYIYNDSKFQNEPFICVRISNNETYNSINELTAINREKISLKGWDIYSTKSENYNLIPFGNSNSVYSYSGIVENELEKLALNAHAVYQNMFSDVTIPKSTILKTFNYSEIDKKSNFANVLHIRYKLKMLGYEIKLFSEATEIEREKSSENLQYLKNIFNDKKTLEYLGQLEHDRWMYFQISEGWKGVSVEEAKIYSEHSGNHKNTKAQLHPCICSWDELDEVVNNFDPHIKDYDTEFIIRIPQILGLEETNINVSDMKYVLIKSK